ncbi:transcriptional regulator [Pseudomonas alloputida]|uniref:Transcriptional regulator n=1 Tax=Pseudomonas alloputida TaxID=1940621 RepID=A0AAW7HHZ1_9PSED|nr:MULTISPECIES: transcriptional regulator [Pseudomonas]MDH0042435.1 transcriptional regulator [Pseudomonas juntendi]MDM3889654.1 transcriptional regulator [Pseudomonas juntendi]MDM3952885.1 transcriptional regulator [Pseudomonas alloputida]
MSTTELSQERDDIAREIETLILQRVARVSQKQLSVALKPRFESCSESTVSRWNDGEYQKWAAALSILGLRVVPQTAVVVTAEYLSALETMARIGLKAERKRPGPLGWD